MRFFVEFSYKGSNYHGWQMQPNANTVQGELNKALTIILNSQIKTVGAGRTDAGVHAKQMFAHFDIEISFDVQEIINKLNGFLPNDIVIHAIFKVTDDVSSRFNAISRTYQFHVIQQKNPFYESSYFLHKNYTFDQIDLPKHLLVQVLLMDRTNTNLHLLLYLLNILNSKHLLFHLHIFSLYILFVKVSLSKAFNKVISN